MLPVLQEADELVPNEIPEEPETREANLDIFFFTCEPPQAGQTTSSVALALRTNSSKSLSHDVQTNSNKGILLSRYKISQKIFLI